MMETICCAKTYDTYLPCTKPTWRQTETCFAHRGAFSKAAWINKYLRRNVMHNILGLDYPQTSSFGRKQKAIEDVIKSGKIVLTQEDIEQIPDHRDMYVIFMILSRFHHINPEWNVPLLYRSLKIFVGLRRRFQRDIYPSVTQYFGELLQNPLFPPERLVGWILRVKQLCPYYDSLETSENARVEFPLIWNELFEMIDKRLALHSYLVIAKRVLYKPNRATLDYYLETLVPLFKELRLQWRKEQRERLWPLKEHIAEFVWHPTHVARWLDIGGWRLVNQIAGYDEDD